MRTGLQRFDFPWLRIFIDMVPVLGVLLAQLSLQQGIWQLEGNSGTYWLADTAAWEGVGNYAALGAIVLVFFISVVIPLSARTYFPQQLQHTVSAECLDLSVAFHLCWYYNSSSIVVLKYVLKFVVIVSMAFSAVAASEPLWVIQSFLPCFLFALYSLSAMFPTMKGEWKGKGYGDFRGLVMKHPNADERALGGAGLAVRLTSTSTRVSRAIACLAAVPASGDVGLELGTGIAGSSSDLPTSPK